MYKLWKTKLNKIIEMRILRYLSDKLSKEFLHYYIEL